MATARLIMAVRRARASAWMGFHGRRRTVYLAANKADGARLAPAGRSQEDAAYA